MPAKVGDHDAFERELDAIEDRIEKVIDRGRDAFFEGSDSYDHASLAIIRLAALFERERFQRLLAPVTDADRRGIATTRNVVAHGGYRTMDDARFWLTVTAELADLLRHLRARAAASSSADSSSPITP